MNKVLSLEDVKIILDNHFRPPFLAEDMVSTEILERDEGNALEITIGRRTVVIDASGEVGDTLTEMWISPDSAVRED